MAADAAGGRGCCAFGGSGEERRLLWVFCDRVAHALPFIRSPGVPASAASQSSAGRRSYRLPLPLYPLHVRQLEVAEPLTAASPPSAAPVRWILHQLHVQTSAVPYRQSRHPRHPPEEPPTAPSSTIFHPGPPPSLGGRARRRRRCAEGPQLRLEVDRTRTQDASCAPPPSSSATAVALHLSASHALLEQHPP